MVIVAVSACPNVIMNTQNQEIIHTNTYTTSSYLSLTPLKDKITVPTHTEWSADRQPTWFSRFSPLLCLLLSLLYWLTIFCRMTICFRSLTILCLVTDHVFVVTDHSLFGHWPCFCCDWPFFLVFWLMVRMKLFIIDD